MNSLEDSARSKSKMHVLHIGLCIWILLQIIINNNYNYEIILLVSLVSNVKLLYNYNNKLISINKRNTQDKKQIMNYIHKLC